MSLFAPLCCKLDADLGSEGGGHLLGQEEVGEVLILGRTRFPEMKSRQQEEEEDDLQLCSHLLVDFLGCTPVLWVLGSVEETLGPRPLQDSILRCLTLLESRAVSSPLSYVWQKGCCHPDEPARPCVVCHRQDCCGLGGRAAAVSQ